MSLRIIGGEGPDLLRQQLKPNTAISFGRQSPGKARLRDVWGSGSGAGASGAATEVFSGMATGACASGRSCAGDPRKLGFNT